MTAAPRVSGRRVHSVAVHLRPTRQHWTLRRTLTLHSQAALSHFTAPMARQPEPAYPTLSFVSESSRMPQRCFYSHQARPFVCLKLSRLSSDFGSLCSKVSAACISVISASFRRVSSVSCQHRSKSATLIRWLGVRGKNHSKRLVSTQTLRARALAGVVVIA